MEFIGKITTVLPVKSGTTQNGKGWKSQEFVVETVEQYPKRGCFQVMNDNIERFGLQTGMVVRVQFDMNAREWEGRYYNTLTAWNVEIK